MKRILLLLPGLLVIGVSLLLSAGCSGDVDAERAKQTDAVPAAAERKAAISDATPAVVVDAKPVAAKAEPAFREVTIPAGTRVLVRLESGVNSKTSHVEDRVSGTVSTAVTIGETLVLPEGSQVRGDVVIAEPRVARLDCHAGKSRRASACLSTPRSGGALRVVLVPA